MSENDRGAPVAVNRLPPSSLSGGSKPGSSLKGLDSPSATPGSIAISPVPPSFAVPNPAPALLMGCAVLIRCGPANERRVLLIERLPRAHRIVWVCAPISPSPVISIPAFAFVWVHTLNTTAHALALHCRLAVFSASRVTSRDSLSLVANFFLLPSSSDMYRRKSAAHSRRAMAADPASLVSHAMSIRYSSARVLPPRSARINSALA
mmetsp:Transcript_10819/g.26469  ORF Transcript_10819/g.26469 Transcript_10819/m.26469 type:complete len:207 (+) Transcript_10819:830-1450(+)